MELRQGFYRIDPRDNVATALRDIPAGTAVVFGASDGAVKALEPIAFGHKVALGFIARGGDVVKYGHVIGAAAEDIPEGACVDSRNCVSRIGVTADADVYRPGARTQYTLAGYARATKNDTQLRSLECFVLTILASGLFILI